MAEGLRRGQLDGWKDDIVFILQGDRVKEEGSPEEDDSCHLLGPPKFFKSLRTLCPWVFTIILGAIVAINGAFITHNADWFGDFRFGLCWGGTLGPHPADRKACCGGMENYDETRDKCIEPQLLVKNKNLHKDLLQWYEWEEIFGQDSRASSWSSYLVAFFVYTLSSIFWTAICCFIVFEFAPEAKGSGIPEVKASVCGFDLTRNFSPITLLLKSVGLSLVVGAGLALGKEGPLIQVGVCWAHILCNLKAYPLFNNRYRNFGTENPENTGLFASILEIPQYEWSFVGAATGVSTAFGAPLGGILFAVEELGSVRTLTRRALLLCFLGSFSASFMLRFLNISGSNSLTMFSLSTASNNFRKEWAVNEIWVRSLRPSFVLFVPCCRK